MVMQMCLSKNEDPVQWRQQISGQLAKLGEWLKFQHAKQTFNLPKPTAKQIFILKICITNINLLQVNIVITVNYVI